MKTIKLEENGNILTFNFLNGRIELDKSIYGAYAICPGCGSGKTTIIKELIKLKWHEGILYSAFTIDEVDKMYQWIKCNMIDTKIIKSEDIIVLHSNITSEGVDNNLWRNNPQEIMNKKIILCTHSKILNEPIELLFGTTFIKPNNYYTSKRIIMEGIGSLPRQWILIDEGIDIDPISRKVDKSYIAGLGMVARRIRNIIDDNSKIYRSTELKKPILVKRLNSFIDFKDEIDVMKEYNPGLKELVKDEKNELDSLRNQQILEELFDDYERYVNTKDEIVNLSYGLPSLSFSDLKTHLLLFDGTSDITLKNSKKFQLLTYQDKYSGNVSLSVFPFDLERNLKDEANISDLILRDKIDRVIDNLTNIIKSNSKTLIFCWKSFKSHKDENDNEDADEFNGDIIRNDIKMTLNKYFVLPNYLKFKLEEKGFVEGKEFSIEYYGSGRDKAINDYREYDGVVLLGKYVVPNSVIGKFNISYDSNIGFTEYYSNRVMQAICRANIRLHDPKLSLNIYMSSDWSNNVVNYVKYYLGIGISSISSIGLQADINYFYENLRSKGITPKKAENIAKVCSINSNIFSSIMMGLRYECRIKLDDLYSILPKSQKKSKEYNSLVSSLSNLGITLDIQ